MAKQKWDVDLKIKLTAQLEESKLRSGEVSKKVQMEIKKAIQHAVASTLSAHGLLSDSASARFSAASSDAVRPIKPSH